MKHRLGAVVAAAFVVVFVATVRADVVELKNGQRVEGVLKQADQSTVTVEVGGQAVTFKSEQVKAIYYGSVASAPSVAGPAVPSPLANALRALKDLQSVVRGGVSFRDYGPRVTEANIVVDRFLETPVSGDEGVHDALRDAIGFHQVAVRLWTVKVEGKRPVTSPGSLDIDFRGAVALFDKCPATQLPVKGLITIDESALKPAARQQWRDPLSELWNCADERIATAAKISDPGR